MAIFHLTKAKEMVTFIVLLKLILTHTYLEMTWMSELSTTVFACKSALVVVNEHMVVQAVLPCKCSIADKAHKWFYSCK